MTLNEISVLISLLAMIFSIMFNTMSKRRVDTKDVEEKAKREAVLETKLDSIISGVDLLNKRFDKLEDRVSQLEKAQRGMTTK